MELNCKVPAHIRNLFYRINSNIYLGRYIPGPAGEGSAALASNPEVRSLSGAVGSAAARLQQDSLRTLTARLKDAYNGVEVQWKDAGSYFHII